MQNPIGAVLLIVFGAAGITAIVIVINLLFPSLIERTRGALQTSPGRSLLLGIVDVLCVAILDALFIWLAQLLAGARLAVAVLVAAGGLLTLVAAALILLGAASLAAALGAHIGQPKGDFDAIWRGSLLLILAAITPFIGWFAFTPLLLATSLGAAVQATFPRRAGTA